MAVIRIGVDGRYQGQPLTGVPRYIDELCRELDVLLPEAQFFMYAASAEGISLPSSRWQLRVEPLQVLSRLKPTLWWKLFAHRLVRKDKLDVFWASAGFLPGGISAKRCVLTVYDLTFRLYPETMSRFNLWAYRLFFKRDLLRANSVVAISQGTSDRLREHFDRSADAVVRPDAAPRFTTQSEARIAELKAKYKLHAPFVLAVSTLEPRKNFTSLIDAFVLLKRRGELPGHELVLIGKKGWGESVLGQTLTDDEQGSIRTLGFVPDDDLPALYSACQVFCMPSLYEGFGMPVLEARRCGARVVTTDIPELREAGDADCVYVAATPDAIADGIHDAILKAATSSSSITSWQREAKLLLSPILQSCLAVRR